MSHMYVNYRIMDGQNFLFFEIYDKNNVIKATTKNFNSIANMLSDKQLLDNHMLLATYINSDKSYKLTNEELESIKYNINQKMPKLEIIIQPTDEIEDFSNN